MERRVKVAGIEQGVYHSPALPFLAVRTTLDSMQPYAPHVHDALSLGLVFKGRTRLRCGGGECVLGEGDMVLIAPGAAHSCNPVGGCRSYHMFYIDVPWVLAALGRPDGSGVLVGKRVVRDGARFAKLTALACALKAGRGDAGGVRVLAGLVRECCGAACGGEASLVADTLEQMGGGVDSRLGIDEMALRFGMGREGFIRAFRREAGISPGRYRQCLRLARACRMLRAGRDIVQTALECGYADQSHLHRMCVKYLSATPRQLQS